MFTPKKIGYRQTSSSSKLFEKVVLPSVIVIDLTIVLVTLFLTYKSFVYVYSQTSVRDIPPILLVGSWGILMMFENCDLRDYLDHVRTWFSKKD